MLQIAKSYRVINSEKSKLLLLLTNEVHLIRSGLYFNTREVKLFIKRKKVGLMSRMENGFVKSND